MNKKRVNDWILPARKAINEFGIANAKGEVVKTFRGQIATFGAAVVMGSLKSAVAFFADNGDSTVKRDCLIKAMYYIIERDKKEPKEIFDFVCANDNFEMKEKFIDASIAIKLALNFFDLVDGDNKKNGES